MPTAHDDAADYGLPRRWITLALFAVAIIFAVLAFNSKDDRGTIAACLLGTIFLAVFWPLIAKVDNLKIGTTGVELTRKVDEANAKADNATEKASSALMTITRFVFNSMPQPTFVNLEKIASGRFGPFHMDDSFRQQLRYLRDSGYIATNEIYIKDIPVDEMDLSKYVFATDLGREFIVRRLATEEAARQETLAAHLDQGRS